MKFLKLFCLSLLSLSVVINGGGVTFSMMNCEKNAPVSCCDEETDCSCYEDVTATESETCCEVSSKHFSFDPRIVPSAEKIKLFETGTSVFSFSGISFQKLFHQKNLSWLNPGIPLPRSGITFLYFTHTLLI